MHDPITSIKAILSNLHREAITAAQAAHATQAMIAILTEPHSLTYLYLWRNNMGDAGAQVIAEALKDPRCTLTYLSLEHNNIGPVGAIALADALIHPHCKLTQLVLNGNNIGPEGASVLAKALIHPNCKLTQLVLNGNNIGPEGASVLAEALIHPNCKLTKLNLEINNIGPVGTKALAEALPRCTLAYLSLWFNNIGDEGAQALAEALPRCTLAYLSLWFNNIGDEGAQALAEALPHCKVINLNLNNNNIGPDGAQALADAALACARKGRLITITGAYSRANDPSDFWWGRNKEQQIQETYKTYKSVKLTKSYQRLAFALAVGLKPSPKAAVAGAATPLAAALEEVPCDIGAASLAEALEAIPYHALLEIASAHEIKRVLPDVTKRFAAERAAAHTTLSIKQCVLSLGLGLATTAFTAHMLGLTGATATLLSIPFAVSLAVGAFVTALAFCAASSCMPVCLPNTQTAASSKMLSSAHTAAGAAPTDASRQHTPVALERALN